MMRIIIVGCAQYIYERKNITCILFHEYWPFRVVSMYGPRKNLFKLSFLCFHDINTFHGLFLTTTIYLRHKYAAQYFLVSLLSIHVLYRNKIEKKILWAASESYKQSTYVISYLLFWCKISHGTYTLTWINRSKSFTIWFLPLILLMFTSSLPFI